MSAETNIHKALVILTALGICLAGRTPSLATGGSIEQTLPDLAVDAITMTPSPATLGRSATISAIIINSGTGDIPPESPFFIDFLLAGQICHRHESTAGLPARGSIFLSTQNCAPSAPGCHEVKVVADPTDAIEESDENNNELSHEFCWEPEPDPFCGDGVRNEDEECDGADLGGETCLTLGFDGGSLACTEDCTFDVSGCEYCGDGVLNAGEECDGNDLGGLTCKDLGYAGGTLKCTENCRLDRSDCEPLPTCGDGVRNEDEECDGADLGGATCESIGHHGGALACREDCTFDITGCERCGDGILNGDEQCDGADLGGATCESIGHHGGTLGCQPDCTFDISGCERCGDLVINGDEECDGTQLGQASCVSLGFDGGTLRCAPDCTFDTSLCEYCGDGIRNGREQCDGSDLGGRTCELLGYDGGVLRCTEECTLDTSACITHPADEPGPDTRGEVMPPPGNGPDEPKGSGQGCGITPRAPSPAWPMLLLCLVMLLGWRRRARP